MRKINATNVLIVTNRPAIANSWFDDFKKFISWQETEMKFVSETDSLKDKALSREDFIDFLNSTNNKNPSQITFISLQDLKGAKFAGGGYEKLEWVGQLNWDLLIIDEAHEGVDTAKRTWRSIKSNGTLLYTCLVLLSKHWQTTNLMKTKFSTGRMSMNKKQNGLELHNWK